jgi:uncharacterized damage-inducible protein DinB
VLGHMATAVFKPVGDLVRHIFSAEKRYIDRLSNRPLTDADSIPNGNVEALFQFGRQSRTAGVQVLLALTPDPKSWRRRCSLS